jgi:P27 family predicted phage terminase small subunit
MATRGRKPGCKQQPDKIVDGTRPTPPAHLDAEAKKAWTSLCDDLEAMGTLVRTDRKLIELYAMCCADLVHMRKQLASESYTTGTDRKFINPLVPACDTLKNQLRRLLLDFGMSPSKRKNTTTQGVDDPYVGLGDI